MVDKEFSGLSQAQQAHEYMEADSNSGKIVLTVGGAQASL